MKKKRFLPDNSMEYKSYINKLTDDEKAFIKEFYKDLAVENHNSVSRDLMDVAQRRGELSSIDENTKGFMNDASDDWDWQNTYHQFGFKAAALLIYEQTELELQNKLVNVKTTLNRFFEKMSSLKRINWRDRKHKRTQK